MFFVASKIIIKFIYKHHFNKQFLFLKKLQPFLYFNNFLLELSGCLYMIWVEYILNGFILIKKQQVRKYQSGEQFN